MSPPEFTLLFITVAVGALFQVSIGFGLGLPAAPVIAIFDPSLTPVVVLLLATGVTAAVLVLEGGHLDLRGAGWALAGRVPGAVGGAALVARQLALLVAVVVLVGVAVSLRGFVPVPRRRAVPLAGLMSGLMGTATSIGGPPMAMVWQRLSGSRLRATMSGFFLAGSVMSLAILAATGAVHTYGLWHTALLAPAAAIGVLLSRPLSSRLDMRRTRGVAMVLAVASATVLVIQQFVRAEPHLRYRPGLGEAQPFAATGAARRSPVTLEEGSRPALEIPVIVSPSTVMVNARFSRRGLVMACRQASRSPSSATSASGTSSPAPWAVPVNVPSSSRNSATALIRPMGVEMVRSQVPSMDMVVCFLNVGRGGLPGGGVVTGRRATARGGARGCRGARRRTAPRLRGRSAAPVRAPAGTGPDRARR